MGSKEIFLMKPKVDFCFKELMEEEEYAVLQKCIHVGILDFTLFEEDEDSYEPQWCQACERKCKFPKNYINRLGNIAFRE